MNTHHKARESSFAVFRGALTVLTVSLIIALGGAPALATSYTIDVNTTSLSGTSADLAFDFLYGGGTLFNTITLSGFTTDGTLGTDGPNSGNVTGTLPGPVTLSTTGGSFFNEYLTGLILGTDFSFQLDATANGPDTSSLPDAFSLFILDSTASYSLVSTNDPTGSDALLVFNIDGTAQGAMSTYSTPEDEVVVTAENATPPTSVPEPSSLLLVGSGLGFLVVFARRCQSRTGSFRSQTR